MNWQPIETAPRDGTFFIGANSEVAIVCNWPSRRTEDYAMGTWFYDRKRREWNGSLIPTRLPLTHWKPLPELPETTK